MKSKLPSWPEGQKIDPMVSDPEIAFTDFADHADYHPSLTDKILKLSQSQKHIDTSRKQRGFCGTKILDIAGWNIPEAQLINDRAVEFFKRTLNVDEAVIDDSWGNIYHNKDYCLPHSHLRAKAGVVYFLDPGDLDPDDPVSGRVYKADPRVKHCNAHEPGHMTRLLVPIMTPGTMVIFPGHVVHGVNPYYGKKPRITLSWNINATRQEGSAKSTFLKGSKN